MTAPALSARQRQRQRRSSPWWLRYEELRNWFRHPAAQRALWRDAAAMRRWYRRVAPEFPPVRPGRVALLASMSAYLYGNKLEAMLGLGLRREGWRVRVLLDSRKNILSRRVFSSLGFDDFVYWEDFDAADDPAADAEAGASLEKWLAGDLTVQTVKQWTIGPCWLGPQIISMLHRRRQLVGLDLNAPEIREALADVARFAVSRARRADAILRAVQPQLLYLMEPNYAQFGPLVDHAIARKIRVIHTVQPNRDDAMYFWRLDLGTRREHPVTVPLATLDAVAAGPWTETHERRLDEQLSARYSGKWFLQRRNQIDAVPRSREEILRQLDLDPDRKIVTVFSHVLWDANLFYGDDLFDDYGDWFVQTALAAYRNPAVNWLIKLHPANISKRRQEDITAELAEIVLLRDKCGPIPPHVHLLLPDCGISSLSLYQISDAAVTVRGTCGSEMPCFGSPVLTAGTGRYSGLGFTVDSHSRAEYLDRLAHIQDLGPLGEAQVRRARQHAYTAFVRRPWKMRSFRAEFREDLKAARASADPLVHNLLPVAENLRDCADLAQWARWAEDGASPDYLDQDDLKAL